MLWVIIYALIKVLLLLALVLLAVVTYSHFVSKQRCAFYQKQGVVVVRGADTFFVGNVLQLLEITRLKSALTNEDKPIKPTL